MTNRSRGRRRWLRRAAVGATVLFIIVGGLWFTGVPQKWAVETAVKRFAGIEVEVSGVAVWPVLHVNRLQVFSSSAARQSNSPTFTLEDVEVAYRLRPPAGRYVSHVDVRSVEGQIDLRDPDDTNIDFLRPFLEGGDEPPDNRFLPQRIAVGSVSGEILLPAAGFRIREVEIRGTFPSFESFGVELFDNEVDWTWWFDTPDQTQTVNAGYANLRIDGRHSRVRNELIVGVPGFAEARGLIQITDVDGNESLEAKFSKVRLYGPHWQQISEALLDYPIRFAEAACENLTLTMPLSEGDVTFPMCLVDGEVTRLVVGDPDHALYSGDIEFGLNLKGGDRADGLVSLVFNDLGSINIEFNGDLQRADATAEFANWTREAFVKAAPVDLRAYLEELDFDSVTGEVTARWAEPQYDVDARISSRGASSATESPIFLGLSVAGSTESQAALEGFLDARLGEGHVQAQVHSTEEDVYTAKASLARLRLAHWVGLFPRVSIPESFDALVDGTIDVSSRDAAENLDVSTTLTINDLEFGSYRDERIELTGGLVVAESFSRVQSLDLQLNGSDGVTRLALHDWDLNLEPVEGGGPIEVAVDLDTAGEMSGISDLYGTVTAQGVVTVAEGVVDAKFEYVSDDAAYGEMLLPYGTSMTGSATLAYEVDTGRGEISGLETWAGQGTKLTADAIAFATDPVDVEGRIYLTSDLQLITEMDYLADAEGKFSADADLRVVENELRATWSSVLVAERAALADESATIVNLDFRANGDYVGGLNGTGQFTAELVSIAGARIHGLGGSTTFQGDDLLITDASGTVFEGTFEARGNVGLLRENLPIQLSADVRDFDLKLLTEEVQPPKVTMTGRADGSFSLRYSEEGLTAFTVDAYSDRGFTLNRSLVQEILQGEQFQNILGVGRVERAMGKFLGPYPQRPFDSAELFLYLEGDQFKGYARLSSEKTEQYNGLNLNLTLTVDKPALTEALKLLEQSSSVK